MYQIEDPRLVKELTVGKDGRIYLGKDFSGDRIRVCVEDIEGEE